jgi:putative transposase
VFDQYLSIKFGMVTYLWIGDRWRHLITVLDLYRRKIFGFTLLDYPDSALTKLALSNAFEARGKPIRLMFIKTKVVITLACHLGN